MKIHISVLNTFSPRSYTKRILIEEMFQLPYTMSVDISNPSALTSSLNISQAGEIPVGGLQTWALALHCGPYDAEVDLSLRINVSLSRRNTTSLDFRRKKICLKDKSNAAGPEEVLVAASGSSPGGQVFYAAIGCACAFIAAIFVLVIAYYVRDKKTRRHRDPLQYVLEHFSNFNSFLFPLSSSLLFTFTFDSISPPSLEESRGVWAPRAAWKGARESGPRKPSCHQKHPRLPQPRPPRLTEDWTIDRAENCTRGFKRSPSKGGWNFPFLSSLFSNTNG